MSGHVTHVMLCDVVGGNFAGLTWLKDMSKCRMAPSDRPRHSVGTSRRRWPLTEERRSDARAVSIESSFSCTNRR